MLKKKAANIAAFFFCLMMLALCCWRASQTRVGNSVHQQRILTQVVALVFNGVVHRPGYFA